MIFFAQEQVLKAIGVLIFAVVIGLLMALLYCKDDQKWIVSQMVGIDDDCSENRGLLEKNLISLTLD